jgi:hypothetical protein
LASAGPWFIKQAFQPPHAKTFSPFTYRCATDAKLPRHHAVANSLIATQNNLTKQVSARGVEAAIGIGTGFLVWR